EAERAQAAAEDEAEWSDFRRYRLLRHPLLAPSAVTNQSSLDTAIALLFKHPELLNLSQDGGEAAAYVLGIIEDAIGYDGMLLADAIAELGANWRTSVPVLDEPGPDGIRQQMTTPGENPGDPPVPLFSEELAPEVKAALVGPLRLAVKEVKDCEFLRDKQWSVQAGSVGREQPERRIA
ncbi:hypothetical protein, partial [Hymenobacter agri]